MTLDLDALQEMTDVYDSFAPDVVVDLIAEIRRLREENNRARIVADHWRESLCNGDPLTHWAAHPLCMVLAALGGETDPVQLGITPGSDAERLLSMSDQPMGREG